MKLTEDDREALHLAKGLLENLTDNYTIKQLARRSGLNADKLKKGFRYLFGEPIHQYHLNYKMNAAKKLLIDTTMHIDEIAYSLGYNDANNFSAAFKKIVGMRPGEWRKRQVES